MQFTGSSPIVAVILCSVLVASTFIEEVVESNCNWPITNWCHNLSNAKDCQATRHCIQAVWEKHLVPVDSNPVCEICKDMIEQARINLYWNNDQVELEQLFDDSCEQMPIQLIEEKCRKNTRNSLSEVIELMSSQMSQEQICTVMDLCNSDERALDESALGVEPSQIVDQLDEQLVINSNDLESALEDNSMPQLPQCFACKSAFRLAKKLVRSHTSNEKLKNAMNRCCNKLGKLADKCHRVINRHGDQLARFAKNPRVICSLLGMCFPLDQDKLENEEVALDKLESDPLDNKYSEKRQLNTDLASNAQIDEPQQIDIGIKGSPKCSICRTAMKALQHMVRNRAEKGSIQRALHRVCQKLGKLKGGCERMVARHGNQIVDLFTKNTAGRQICKIIGSCRRSIYVEDYVVEQNDYSENFGTESEYSIDDQPILDETLTDIALGSPKCSICQTAIKTLQHIVRHHTDKGEIARAMAHICHKMGKMQHECEEIINNHAAQIIDLMIRHTPVHMICKAIHVCRSSNTGWGL